MLIISEILNNQFKIHRDTTTDTTSKQSRPDMHLKEESFPPLILFEEKPTSKQNQIAFNELKSKFKYLPHYYKLGFVLGITITQNIVNIYKMPTMSFVAKYDLNNLTDRIK